MTVVPLLGISIPVFVLGLTLSVHLVSPARLILPVEPASTRASLIPNVTNFMLIDTYPGRAAGMPFVDALRHLILPAISLGSIPLAIITRITRGGGARRDQRGLRPDRPGQGSHERRIEDTARHAQRLAAA